MSKIPTPAKMEPKKSIYSNSRAPSPKVKSHVCPRTNEMAALKNRIMHLERIIEELHSRNNTRDIEKLMQKNTIDHQTKLLEIIDRIHGETDRNSDENRAQAEKVKNHQLLLDVRTNFIEHLLENEVAIRNLLKDKQANESAMRQMECLLMEKERTISILRAVLLDKERRLSEMELIRTACEHSGKTTDQNHANVQERISNLVTENMRYRTLCSLTQG